MLLADEPTSGLDSHSCDIVINTLANAAKGGCAVIVTIHQPSAQVFRVFDTICLLGAGGGQAWFGGPGGAIELARQRREVNAAAEVAGEADTSVEAQSPPMLMHLNPAEELLEYIVDVGQEGAAVFEASAAKAELDAAVAQALARDGVGAPAGSGRLIQANGEASLAGTTPRPTLKQRTDLPGGYVQFEMLSRRGMRQVVRDPSLMFLQLVVTILVGVLTGALFYKPGLDLNGVHNRTGLLFFIVIYFSLISMSSIGSIVSDKETFMRNDTANISHCQNFRFCS